jgi:hypothetical protein
MQATQEREQRKDLEQHRRDTLIALISEQLLHTLGAPGDLLKVQVRPLWANHYRANVFVGLDIVSAKVAHSYFLTVDANGNIMESTPKLTKQYVVATTLVPGMPL